MPFLTSSDFTTLVLFIVGIAALLIALGIRYTEKPTHVQKPTYSVSERWLPCERCSVAVPTALYVDRDNPFHIQALCTYCALCSDVEPFVLYQEEEHLL